MEQGVHARRDLTLCALWLQALWKELTFLYEKYDEFDNALRVMMGHDAAAWEHVRFKDVAVKCSAVDIFYTAVSHYFAFHPDLVNDLLKVRVAPPVATARCASAGRGNWRLG
jgi:hypothetical protein